MSKITLNPVPAGFNLSKINYNFEKIEQVLNDGVLWRQPPPGEPNQMHADLDMNGHTIYNAFISDLDTYYNAEESDLRFVHRDGDNMNGPLNMSGFTLRGLPPSSTPDSAVPKEELTAEVNNRISADQSLQSQINDTTGPVPASQFSVISWHGRVVENSVVIPDDVNAWSIGPDIQIAAGQEVLVGAGSTWSIVEGNLV